MITEALTDWQRRRAPGSEVSASLGREARFSVGTITWADDPISEKEV